jgi:hypothetical protein
MKRKSPRQESAAGDEQEEHTAHLVRNPGHGDGCCRGKETPT